jgi:hypothetical protein
MQKTGGDRMLHVFAARKPEVAEPLHWVWASTREEAERRRAALAEEGELVSEINEDAQDESSSFHLQATKTKMTLSVYESLDVGGRTVAKQAASTSQALTPRGRSGSPS